MNISFAITVKDEVEEVKRLIPLLDQHLKEGDEIVVLCDDRGPSEIWEYLCNFKGKGYNNQNYRYVESKGKFNNDFAEWKNKLNELCLNDFIVNIDADEYPSDIFLENIHELLKENPECEAYWVPRENYVEGLTPEWINKWGWRVDKLGRINYPDAQLRVFKRDYERIKWKNKVHEQLIGYKFVSALPEEFCFIHKKSLEKQINQNNFYNTL